MANPCRELFDYAARFVTADDVSAYAPSDPGYPEYVRTFDAILAAGEPPAHSNFEITETIGLTRWADANLERDPPRFRRFRTFANAVGVALRVAGVLADDDIAGNYLAINLIEDAHELRDAELLRLLGPAFDAVHKTLRDQSSGEAPFLSLGRLLVAAELGSSDRELSTLAVRVAVEAFTTRIDGATEFLWDCTYFDQLRRHWEWHVARLLGSRPDGVAVLRDALLPAAHADEKPAWPS
jgi:hypothetical protein